MAMYNLGRYVDDTKGEWVSADTTQGQREAEFSRWLREHDRELSEHRWDQGYHSGALYGFGPLEIENPHRKPENE